MQTIVIGKIKKKVNSTYNTMTDTITRSCYLKDDCSKQNPVFVLKGLRSTIANTRYNYCSWNNNYYWINDTIFKNTEIVELHCTLDVLATYRGLIKASSTYCKYVGDEDFWSKDIDDDRLSPEVQYTKTNSEHYNIFTYLKSGSVTRIPVNAAEGTVILRCCVTDEDTIHGDIGDAEIKPGIHTYAMTINAFRACMVALGDLFDDSDVLGFLKSVVVKMGGEADWISNITNCIFVPINISYYKDTKIQEYQHIYIGGVSIDFSSISGSNGTIYEITESKYEVTTGTVEIPWSDISDDYPFLKNSRWSQLQLTYPGGYTGIDTSSIKDESTLDFISCINTTTGDWSLKVLEHEGYDQLTPIEQHQALASAGGAMSRSLMSLIGGGGNRNTAGNMISGITNLLGAFAAPILSSGIPNGNVVSSALKGTGVIGSYAVSNNTQVAGGSIDGGNTELFLVTNAYRVGTIFLTCTQYVPEIMRTIADEDYIVFCNERGYPCNKMVSLGNVKDGAYVETVLSSFGSNPLLPDTFPSLGPSQENLRDINTMMNSGIYLE